MTHRASAPSDTSTATTATNLAGGAANQIPFQTAASTTAFADGLTFASNAISAMTIAGGTVTTNIPVFSITRTNNNAAVVKGVEITYTDTTSAAGFLPLAIRGGAAGTTDLLTLSKAGATTVGGLLTVANSSGAIITGGFKDASANATVSVGWANSQIATRSAGFIGFSSTTDASSGVMAAAFNLVSAGVIGLNTSAAAGTAGSLSLANLTASGNVAVATQSPASGAAGTAGTITWDASFIYVCTASGVWKRIGITGGY